MKPSSSFLWITDPWDTLDHSQDTTLRLIQEGILLGIPQFWCDVRSIRLTDEKVTLESHPVHSVGEGRSPEAFQFGKPSIQSPQDFTQVHYRPDPPIRSAYLHPLQMLSFATQQSKSRAKNCEIVNPPHLLFSANEKMEAFGLPQLTPPSLVSSQWEQLQKFGKKEGKTVLKPLDEAQSKGIEFLDWQTASGSDKAKEKLKYATSNFTSPVLLQKYLDGIQDGEIRLWFIDGTLLASVKKLPLPGDFRVNIDQGSQLQATILSGSEKMKAQLISKHLKARKIRLAAVDWIEGWVTDFNFTSPGLIPQMESLLKENLSKLILKALSKQN